MKECEIGANVGRLQVSKLGCFLFGRHRGGRLDQVLRLKHAHIPDLHKLEAVLFRVVA